MNNGKRRRSLRRFAFSGFGSDQRDTQTPAARRHAKPSSRRNGY